ncbi:MAG: hypothetical protein QUS33_12780 [Dehalococcoidia bacterium]|nr:hypothetical protein [Dehalococcoidia bacterium]
MNTQQWILIAINVVGGVLVLGSYVQGLLAHPDNRNVLWGSIPASVQPFYTVSMVSAALGYFAFTYYVLFRIDAASVRVGNQFGFWVFYVIYALILLPSALWMPLTYAAVGSHSTGLYWVIRVVLAVVGLGSLALLAALLSLRTDGSSYAYWLAVAGSAAFCIQTAVLDALVWPAFFRV